MECFLFSRSVFIVSSLWILQFYLFCLFLKSQNLSIESYILNNFWRSSLTRRLRFGPVVPTADLRLFEAISAIQPPTYPMNSLLRRTKFPPYVSSQTKMPLNHQNETRYISYDRLDSWKPNQGNYDTLGEFTIASFNMLAPVYKRMSALDLHTGGRRRESQYEELWKSRAIKTKRFFEEEFLSSVDVIALQEFWLNIKYLNLFREDFYKYGYQLFMLQRTGTKLDSVAIVIKNKSFIVKKVENIYLCNMRDRVALMMWLQHRETGKDIIIANTHLSFPHNNLESLSQVHQMEIITKVMDNFAHRCEISHATRLVVGDFNAEMKSRVCEHLRKAGFLSCFEISPPFNTAVGDPSVLITKRSKTPNIPSNQPELLSAFTPHSYQTPQSGFTSFVSHRNHLKEEVGVDHLFIRPERDPISSQPTNLVDWTLSASILSEEEEVAEEKKAKATKEMASDAATSPKKTVSLYPLTEKAKEEEKIFIDNCTVLPRQKSCQTWDETFRISDHRPVLAKIIFGRKKQSLSTNHDHSITEEMN